MSRPHSLTEGNILTSLMGFALPVLAALFLQTMYGAVDMMIVGQFSHAAEVSAVSTGSWIMQTITTAIVGLAMGTTILLGRKIGEGQPEDAGRVMGASIWIFAVIGLAVTAVMQFLAVPCTAWMRAPKEAFDSTAVYVKSVPRARCLSWPTICWEAYSGDWEIPGFPSYPCPLPAW